MKPFIVFSGIACISGVIKLESSETRRYRFMARPYNAMPLVGFVFIAFEVRIGIKPFYAAGNFEVKVDHIPEHRRGLAQPPRYAG